MMTFQHGTGTAVVTGASSAIGAAYADRLARRGHDLLLIGGDHGRLGGLAARIAAQTGRAAEVLPGDLMTKRDLIALEMRLAIDPAIRVLVNGAACHIDKAEKGSDPDRLERLIQLNAVAMTRLARAAAPAFAARGGGTIINVASPAPTASQRSNRTVTAAKEHVVSLSQMLEHEMGSRGLRIQAVLPAAIGAESLELQGMLPDPMPWPPAISPLIMVDAALAALDRGELITVPSLPHVLDWRRPTARHEALVQELSRRDPVQRHRRVARNADFAPAVAPTFGIGDTNVLWSATRG